MSFCFQCFVSSAVCCNVIGQGCAVGFPGVLLPQMQAGAFPAGKGAESWIASAMAVTILLGNGLAPPLMDRLGRKAASYAVIGSALLGWTVLAVAPNVATLIVGRVIQGISYGIVMPIRPAIIGEYTSPRYRGSFLATISLSQAMGIAVVHLIGSLVSWQYTAIICSSFPLLSLIMTVYSPESPSWLALRGKYDACREAFHWLRGFEEEDELEKMIQSRIFVQQEDEKAKKLSKCEEMKVIARKKEVYKPVVLAIHVYALAQFSGGTTLSSFSTEIIGAMIGSEANTNFWMIELDVLRFVVSVLAVFVVARVRRRTLMFVASAVCIFSHAGIAAYAYAKVQELIDIPWIPLLLLNLQMSTVGFGTVPMAHVITGEIFPLQYRSILGSVSVIMVAATMFIILKTFHGLLLSTGLYGTYSIYGAILGYNTIVIWFLLPETKGRTLQQIEEYFRGEPLVKADTVEAEPLKTSKADAEAEKAP